MKSTTLKAATLFTIAISAIIIVANYDVNVKNNIEVKDSYFSTHPLKEDSTVIIVDMNFNSEEDTFFTINQK